MDVKITALKDQARKSRGAAKDGLEAQIKAAEDQFNLVKARLNKLSHQTESVSKELTEGLTKAWSELKMSVDNASKHLH